jgi:NADH dehydrogenase
LILVVGGTSFLGRSLLTQLREHSYPLRILLEPAASSPSLPAGLSFEAALSSLQDDRGIRAAMVGVDTILYVGGASLGIDTGDPSEEQGRGAETLVAMAREAGVRRIIYVSQLGADRASAYPMLQANARVEEAIQHCGLDYTILRSSVLFGDGDAFTTGLAQLIAASPLFFFLPGDGQTTLQPLWVEDLATCVLWSLDLEETIGNVYSVGGPEYFTLEDIVRLIMSEAAMLRIVLKTRPPYLRFGTRIIQRILPSPPVNTHWIDYLAVSRTTDLNTLPRVFGLAPARMEDRLGYLRARNWGWVFLRNQFRRHR